MGQTTNEKKICTCHHWSPSSSASSTIITAIATGILGYCWCRQRSSSSSNLLFAASACYCYSFFLFFFSFSSFPPPCNRLTGVCCCFCCSTFLDIHFHPTESRWVIESIEWMHHATALDTTLLPLPSIFDVYFLLLLYPPSQPSHTYPHLAFSSLQKNQF